MIGARHEEVITVQEIIKGNHFNYWLAFANTSKISLITKLKNFLR